MCHNEYDANRQLALSVRRAPRAPLTHKRELTPAGTFWLSYLGVLALFIACAIIFWL